MSALVDAVCVLVAAAGIVVGFAVVVRTRDVRAAIRAALELWTAAGALRLAGDPGWNAIGTAAAILAVRKLAGTGLSRRARA